ncbi:ABC transporter permease subunit [Planctomyces sp. SH-PL62]|uniref:ABC transporter permease subunit n=1 Tax=Planctomyces sp. SH-PL62 TaxID=1636152 RepID=UPI00078D4F66|nr:ABC transporter permease subunit [Planctomyces sp. SH-PL62]AMV39621.1 ABC-2 family transporter protein [Planctomyces sp. SH-PL62]
MALRLGLGPVFVYEWLRTSRRWQLYASRAGFVAVLLCGLGILWASQPRRVDDGLSIREVAAFGRSLYETIANTELTLVLLAAPAATAGAVCLDKSRGSLLQVMATDLTDAEIVLGKLGSGLLPVVGLVFCVLPVMMLASLLGGSDPVALVGSFAVMLGTAVLACTLAFAMSVWGRKTHEVLSATYLILILWIAGVPFLGLTGRLALHAPSVWIESAFDLLLWTNPYRLVAPAYNEPASDHLARVGAYLAGCLGLSALMAGATIARIRPVTLRQQGEAAQPARHRTGGSRVRLPALLPSPSLDANPVLWREWSRMRPSRWGRAIWVVYSVIAVAVTWLAIASVLTGGVGRMGDAAIFANIYLVGVGLLLLSVRAATTLSEERVRGSLDVLLTTPMSTPAILAGKWWGTFRLVPLLALLPGVIGFTACLGSSRWGHLLGLLALILAYGAAVISAGLAISVWVARQGRVLALSVGLYVAACVGWVVFAVVVFRDSNTTGPMVAMGSPIYGPVFGTIGVLGDRFIGPSGMMDVLPYWLLAWNAAYWTLAVVLFQAARFSFDACLGRATGRVVDEPAEDGFWALLPRFRRREAETGEPSLAGASTDPARAT